MIYSIVYAETNNIIFVEDFPLLKLKIFSITQINQPGQRKTLFTKYFQRFFSQNNNPDLIASVIQ